VNITLKTKPVVPELEGVWGRRPVHDGNRLDISKPTNEARVIARIRTLSARTSAACVTSPPLVIGSATFFLQVDYPGKRRRLPGRRSAGGGQSSRFLLEAFPELYSEGAVFLASCGAIRASGSHWLPPIARPSSSAIRPRAARWASMSSSRLGRTENPRVNSSILFLGTKLVSESPPVILASPHAPTSPAVSRSARTPPPRLPRRRCSPQPATS
jgi:hypothetical protein